MSSQHTAWSRREQSASFHMRQVEEADERVPIRIRRASGAQMFHERGDLRWTVGTTGVLEIHEAHAIAVPQTVRQIVVAATKHRRNLISVECAASELASQAIAVPTAPATSGVRTTPIRRRAYARSLRGWPMHMSFVATMSAGTARNRELTASANAANCRPVRRSVPSGAPGTRGMVTIGAAPSNAREIGAGARPGRGNPSAAVRSIPAGVRYAHVNGNA